MSNCIVIGGGVIGLFTAYMLNQAGAHVRLFERGKLGEEASWAGGGILSPLYPWRYSDQLNRLSRQARDLYPSIAQSLLELTGIDPEWNQSGLLMLDNNETDKARLWAETNSEPYIIETDSLRLQEDRLSTAFEMGFRLPTVAQIHTPRLIKSLAASLMRHGVGIHEQEAVESLNIRNDTVLGIRTAKNTYTAENVVIAGGAWSSSLMPEWKAVQDIHPVRGQMIRYAAKPGLLRNIVLYQGKYLIPRRDGGILAGSTLETVGFDSATTQEARIELHNAAANILPDLKDIPVSHHWAGLRPAVQSEMPSIGKHHKISGLFVNSGHFRYGILLAPVSAQLITQIITGDKLNADAG